MDKADEYMISLKPKLIFGFGISDLFCKDKKLDWTYLLLLHTAGKLLWYRTSFQFL